MDIRCIVATAVALIVGGILWLALGGFAEFDLK